MVMDLAVSRPLRTGRATRTHLLENWTEQCHEDAAQLIALCYEGHIDSQINDQYQSVWGARRFLSNIVAYPGCGSFYPAASFVALNRHTGEMQGISLASLVAPDVGHITQICVAPAIQGMGVGYELLRRCLDGLRRHGCRKTSLTVTSANLHAIQLYERMGFSQVHQFAAYVWDGL
jgi:ribosomal protein S18 acetylase RimI-like enzyme